MITDAGRARLGALVRQGAADEARSTGMLDAAEVELLRDLLRRLVRHHDGDGDGRSEGEGSSEGEDTA